MIYSYVYIYMHIIYSIKYRETFHDQSFEDVLLGDHFWLPDSRAGTLV